MKRIKINDGLRKKYFSPPLELYMSQIRQICERYNYKITGKIIIEMKNKDIWTYTFNEENKK